MSDSGSVSTSTEFESLGIELDSRNDSPTLRGLAKTQKQEEEVLAIIKQADALGSNTLDLSHKGLLQLPAEVLKLKGLEVLSHLLFSLSSILYFRLHDKQNK